MKKKKNYDQYKDGNKNKLTPEGLTADGSENPANSSLCSRSDIICNTN